MSFTSNVQVAVYQVPKKGNNCCGDSYYYIETKQGFICALADGLGSGEYAKESSQVVIDIIKENVFADVEDIVKKCNGELYGKRGAVLGIVKIDYDAGYYSFSSIGNIGVITVNKEKEKKRHIPCSGYLSTYKKSLKTVKERLDQDMTFLMFSDGIRNVDLSSNFYMHTDPNDIVRSFALQAENEGEDDATLIAMRYKKPTN